MRVDWAVSLQSINQYIGHVQVLGLMDTAEPHKYVTFDTGFLYNKCLALTTAGDAYFIGSGSSRFPCVVRFNIHQKQVRARCVGV